MGSALFLGPTYTVAEVSDVPYNGALTAFLLLSHLPMFLAVVYAFAARHARLAVTGLTSLIVSLFFYHPCRANMYCLGVPVGIWRELDHLAVIWLIGALALHIMLHPFVQRESQFFFTVAGNLIYPVGAVSVATMPYTFMSCLIMVIYAVLVAIVRISLLWSEGDLCGLAPDDDDDSLVRIRHIYTRWIVFCFVLGILFAVAGLICYYIVPETTAGNTVGEGVVHAVWHMCSGFSLLFLSMAMSAFTEAVLRAHWLRQLALYGVSSTLLHQDDVNTRRRRRKNALGRLYAVYYSTRVFV